MHNIDTNVRGKMNDKQETPFMPLDQGLTGRVFQLRVGLDLGIGEKKFGSGAGIGTIY